MSAPAQISRFQQLWLKWKQLRLPWRKQFLAGMDLTGNTFWEFKDATNAHRMRRIVRYNPQAHYSDIKISPQWHQWLRQVRADAPSVQEQQADLQRQAGMKYLAKKADERWANVPSFLDKPRESGVTKPPMEQPPGTLAKPETDLGTTRATKREQEVAQVAEGKRDPWERAKAPGEGWQPEEPGISKPVLEQPPGMLASPETDLGATRAKKRDQDVSQTAERKKDPWERAKAPGEGWQPEAWNPQPAPARR